jgi:hypothetical protein
MEKPIVIVFKTFKSEEPAIKFVQKKFPNCEWGIEVRRNELTQCNDETGQVDVIGVEWLVVGV